MQLAAVVASEELRLEAAAGAGGGGGSAAGERGQPSSPRGAQAGVMCRHQCARLPGTASAPAGHHWHA